MATKIYPTYEELSTVNCHIPCSEHGCTKIFTSQSNLNLHLAKTHKQEQKPITALREFYCPNSECAFNSEKCFKTLKLLKQHFLKVHGEKSFTCDVCNKGFPTLSSKNRHVNYCGVNFKCCDCNAGYMSYESLLTHGRRKKHKVLEKAAYNPTVVRSLDKIQFDYVAKCTKREAYILPKTSSSLQCVNPTSRVVESNSSPTLEKGSQTDIGVGSPKLKTKQTQVLHKRTKQSQTSELRRTRSSAETQTIGDYFCKRPRLSDSDTNLYRKASEDSLLQSVKTQTKLISFKSQSCNTSFELNESDLVPSVVKSSSSTQTSYPSSTELLYSISTATHDSIHTDTSDLNFEFMHSSSQTCFSDDMSLFNSNYFNCNTETQTDFLFDNNLLDYDAESNAFEDDLDNYCQKAYDDIILNTIHTQTVFDDIARSVESQTMMSHTKTKNLACKDMANMETQTENDFKKLLEEINA